MHDSPVHVRVRPSPDRRTLENPHRVELSAHLAADLLTRSTPHADHAGHRPGHGTAIGSTDAVSGPATRACAKQTTPAFLT